MNLIRNTNYLTKYKSELMGICIVWIMLFHSGIEAPKAVIPRSLWYLFVGFGGGYGVDIFLILSGFGLTYSQLLKEKSGIPIEWRPFLTKRMIRILPSYFLVGTAYYLVQGMPFRELIYHLSFASFLLEGRRDFWYIFAILLCYLMFPIFYVLRKKTDFRAVLVGFSAIAYAVALIMKVSIPDYYNKWEIALWRFPCFWMGCYYGILTFHEKRKEFYISTGLFSAFGIMLLGVTGLSRNTFTFTSPCIIVLLCIVLEAVENSVHLIGSILNYLGSISLELYLVHVSLGLYISSRVFSETGSNSIRLVSYGIISVVTAIMVNYIARCYGKLSVKKQKKGRIPE